MILIQFSVCSVISVVNNDYRYSIARFLSERKIFFKGKGGARIVSTALFTIFFMKLSNQLTSSYSASTTSSSALDALPAAESCTPPAGAS